ncbi:tetratricopeptide repeat protein [Streptomyces sp. NPDC001108]
MDVMPQQPPRPSDPDRPPLDASAFSGATALSALTGPPSSEPPPLTLRTALRRTALGVVAGAVLLTGAVVAVPDGGGPATSASPVPGGPVSRAMAAAAAGAPASLSDLTALIGDRRRWVEAHPADAGSWAVLGTAYVEWGRRSADSSYYGRAERALERSLEVQPGERGNTAAWAGLAALADARNDFAEARKWGEAVRTREPERWTVYPALIEAYDGLGDRRAADAAVARFAALRAGTPALVRAARTARDRGRTAEALDGALAAAGRAATPAQEAECLSLLGELARDRGEPQEALARYDAALRAQRDHGPALAGRAGALAALGRTEEALRAYRAVLARQPRPAYLLELGEFYESLGRHREADEEYARLRDALDRDEERGVDNALLRGRFEADHGDPDAAVGLLEAEWARGHRSAAVADALGWARYRAGDPSGALEYAGRAVDAGGGNASYAYHLGMVQRELGQYGPARRSLERALSAGPGFSPLGGPVARKALDDLAAPPADGPQDA